MNKTSSNMHALILVNNRMEQMGLNLLRPVFLGLLEQRRKQELDVLDHLIAQMRTRKVTALELARHFRNEHFMGGWEYVDTSSEYSVVSHIMNDVFNEHGVMRAILLIQANKRADTNTIEGAA